MDEKCMQVGIMTGCRLDYRVWIPGRGRIFSLRHCYVRTGFRAHRVGARGGGRDPPPTVNCWAVKQSGYLHLVPRLRILGAMSPVPHISWWRGA